jgi:hypothetical protein
VRFPQDNPFILCLLGGFKPSGMGGQSTFGLDSSAWGGPNKKYEKKILEIMGSTRNLPAMGRSFTFYLMSSKLITS